MTAFKEKLPEFCGYLATALAASLLAYTAACAPRPQEQWNSYYYGTGAPQMEQGIAYYGHKDVDENYSLPDDMAFAGEERNLQVDSLMHGNRLR